MTDKIIVKSNLQLINIFKVRLVILDENNLFLKTSTILFAYETREKKKQI